MDNKVKIVSVERPAYLPHMRREINWVYEGVDLREAPIGVLMETVRLTEHLKGPTAVGNYIKANQILSGNVLLIVDHRVSLDLEITKVVGELNKIVFPARAMEIRFADPDLPAMLVGRVDKGQLMENGEVVPDAGVVFAADAKDGATLTLSIPDSIWPKYVQGQYNEHMNAFTQFDQTMENDEAEMMRYMTMLAVKVLAFASVPQLGPKLLTTKAEKKEAGLHPKHIKATQKIYSVRYLPHVYREKVEVAHDSSGKTRQFLGRAGTIRFYKDERYVNMKGQWQFIPPIPPPKGIAIIYKVRKPSVGRVL